MKPYDYIFDGKEQIVITKKDYIPQFKKLGDKISLSGFGDQIDGDWILIEWSLLTDNCRLARRVPPVHTFNRAAIATIKEAIAICEQRGGEYQDSWSIVNLRTHWLDNLLRDHPSPAQGMEKEWRRLIVLASMIDIKISRLGGPWKEDTAIDLINYVGAYTGLRREYDVAIKR